MRPSFKVVLLSVMLGLISINLCAADWSGLIGEHKYFVGQALNTPAGQFPYALRLSEDKKSLSTSKSPRGYHSFTLTDDGLSFELKLGEDGYLFKGKLARSDEDSKSTMWIFSGTAHDKLTKMVFSLEKENKLIIITYRDKVEHAKVELNAAQ